MRRRLAFALVLWAALAPAPQLLADVPPVIDCPWYQPTTGDDFATHGFYAAYPGTTLKTVTLYLSFPSPGSYSLSLVAASGTFGGVVLGRAPVTFTATSTDYTAVVFDFGSVAVTSGTIVTFAGAVASKPTGVGAAVLMETTTDPVCRFTETTGTADPLAAFHRPGVAARITGDPTTTFDHRVAVAAAASAHGANGTFFHTDAWIYNPLSSPVTVTATYRCVGGGACGTGTASFGVPAGQAVTFTDVAVSLFGAAGSSGAIVFAYTSSSTTSTLRVVTRTYTPSQPNPTNGAVLEGRPFINAQGGATLVGLGNNGGNRSAGFRTNAGFFNHYGYANTVTFTLTTKDGTALGPPLVEAYAPFEARQINDIFASVSTAAGSAVTSDAVLHVSSTIPGFPYVTVIDNQSGDSIIEQ